MSPIKLAKGFALDIPVGCVVLFQRTKSLIGGGASQGVPHPTGRLLVSRFLRG